MNIISEKANNTSIAIIGAGPIGLEAALYGASLGYDVCVLEKGTIGQHVAEWGHLRMFSPWKYNYSALGRRLLQEHNPNATRFDDEEVPTGKEFMQHYLFPLSKLSVLKGRIHTHTHVISIGKMWIFKNELIADKRRTDFKFRILARDDHGKEKLFYADIVIDASGIYSNHNWLGNGGIPALGELSLQEKISYKNGDILNAKRKQYAGKTTLLIGAGHSAATTISAFKQLVAESRKTKLLWVTRSGHDLPLTPIVNDSLPLRAALVDEANAIAKEGSRNITFLKGSTVEAVEYAKRRFIVTLQTKEGMRRVKVDNVIANVGYNPDNSLYRELQVHECYASRGPMKLSAALLGETSTDCLTQESHGADTLKNPEPSFYIIGSKSYAKYNTFLLKIGLSQIKEVYSLITENPTLDLYSTPEVLETMAAD
jgi:thioredoxin reductase